MKADPVLSMLSIAAKAGKVKSGGFAAEEAIRKKKAFLVIIAGDASEATRQSYEDMGRHYHVPCLTYSDKAALGQAVGKEYRAAAAVCDEGLANGIRKRAKGMPEEVTEVDVWQR